MFSEQDQVSEHWGVAVGVLLLLAGIQRTLFNAGLLAESRR